MTDWLDGYVQVDGQRQGGVYLDNCAPKYGGHTTEGLSRNPLAAAAHHPWPPQLWYCPLHHPYRPRLKIQIISLSRSGYALAHPSGTPETNRAGVIQCEVEDFAAKTPFWPTESLDAYVDDVIVPVCEAAAIDPRNWLPTGDVNYGYGTNSPSRQFFPTTEDWYLYNGLLTHQHVKWNCVSLETPILTAELEWVPAGELLIGQELIGFDEHFQRYGGTGGRRLGPSFVEANSPFKSEAMRVVTPRGEIICTPDHPWLVRLPYVNRGTRTIWVETKDLDPNKHELYWFTDPWTTDTSHEAGWLAGLLDADGHATYNKQAGGWVGFGQAHGVVLDEFTLAMESRGFNIKHYERGTARGYGSKKPFTDVRVTGGLWEQLRVLGSLRPRRLTLRDAWSGATVGRNSERTSISCVEKAPDTWMSGLQTTSRTYIANGFAVHNTHWDQGDINMEYISARASSILYPATPTPPPPPQTDDPDVLHRYALLLLEA